MVLSHQKIKLHVLTADPQLAAHAREIEALGRHTISQVGKILPLRQLVDIVVYRYHTQDRNFAVSGYTPTGNVVWIYTDPSHRGYLKLLRAQLPRVLAHELHHACRWQGPGFGKTLRETLTTEGLAALFELEVFGGEPSAFYTKFSQAELRKLWVRAERDLDSLQFSYDDWFFGSTERKIPKHAGYALGYWLVSKALSDKNPSELARASARQILK